MSDRPHSSAVATAHARNTQRAWTLGGSLALVAVVLDASLVGPWFDQGFARTLLLAAALIVFAFGIRGSGSVTGRRPVGTIALCLLALTLVIDWLLGLSLNWSIVPLTVSVAAMQVLLIMQYALALVAAERIGRLAIVPRPWNWAPAIAVGVLALVAALTAVVSVVSRDALMVLALFLGNVGGVIGTAALVGLGVLAIVLGDRAGRGHPASPSS
ncbi:hypothetical protein [Chryseoglobus sp. 28M-23]|uniref:hypothetical protein n=1 Tax=Chryseoglobus sp. 28M-23 TaxID=2772253 RepID=UPI001746F1CC|nr:hypothetical protein [Chryseoglobus sp. 28M-23]QOD92760.1 hypothetical protein IE160_07225 [Chryseoglobus sp. 28M-23]